MKKPKLLKHLLQGIRAGFLLMRASIKLRHVYQCVTVFGSAKFKQTHRYCKLAEQLGQALAKQGYAVMTGGGPGIMEAVQRGTIEAGGYTIGCNIYIPYEREPNKFQSLSLTFKYFFIRKVMLTRYANAFIILPGGFGTLDEVFEIVTLLKTGRLDDVPLILMGTTYWRPLLNFVVKTMLKEGTVFKKDLSGIYVTDDINQTLSYIKRRQSKQPTDESIELL